MDRNGDCLGSQWLSLGVAGPEAGSSPSGLYEKGGGVQGDKMERASPLPCPGHAQVPGSIPCVPLFAPLGLAQPSLEQPCWFFP